MNTVRKILALTAAGSLVVALAGCGNSDQPVSIPTPSVQISLPPSAASSTPLPSTPRSTASPTAASPASQGSSSSPASTAPSMQKGSDEDVTSAIATIHAWDESMTKLYANPSLPVDTLTHFASGEALSVSQSRILTLRTAQQRVVGVRHWVSNKTVANSYDGRANYVAVASCIDFSGIKVLDKSGKDVTKRKQNRYLETYVLTKPSNSAWKITSISNSGQSC